jgi:hypothetical protein
MLRVVSTLLALTCFVTSCSYDPAEPGLFGRSTTQQTNAPPIRPQPPEATVPSPNPALPVVGEAIWTSADGLDITVRIAVHAVRRIVGATVLDWSITPLHGPGLGPNDPLSRRLNLGLTRPGEGYPNVLLIDAKRSRVYRPLSSKEPGRGCLCTPTTSIQRTLQIDHTRLLQLAFPTLPDDITTVDVQLGTLPPFWQVPVTPIGMLPLASTETDLARRADRTPFVTSTGPFSYGPDRQHFVITINAVYVSDTFTSIAWTILSIEPGRGLGAASTPPFADAEPPVHPYNRTSAGGPQIKLRTTGSVLHARLITTNFAGHAELECLCTDLRLGANALRHVGQQLSVVTDLPPVGPQMSEIDVVLPGLTTLQDIAVTRASDSTFRSAGPAVRNVGWWNYLAGTPHSGWDASDWPTPVPRPSDVRAFRSTVDKIVR